jgi:predicted transcriptional regulator
MKISELASLLEAEILCCEDELDIEISNACGSDMMSDVLAYVKDQTALLTGLVNPQVVRTAMMVDMRCIIFVRQKSPTPEIIKLASENHIVLLATKLRMYEACGRLYVNGLGRKD